MYYVGFAEREINPEIGVELAGYSQRENVGGISNNKRCDGGFDSLFVKVLVLYDGKRQSVIISYDSLGLGYEFVSKIKSELALKCKNLDSSDILMASTHTHSAPAAMVFSLIGDIDKEYLNLLEKKTLEAFVEAYSNKATAEFMFGTTTLDWNHNRRVNNYQPELIDNATTTDHTVSVLRIDTSETIVVFSYACHPAILNKNKFSSDYVGYARKLIEETNVTGKSRTRTLFLNGSAGNLNPCEPNLKIDLSRKNPFNNLNSAQQMGKTLGLTVNELLPNTVNLPERPIENKLIQADRLKSNFDGKEISVDVQIMKFNSMCLVGIPGEPFVETGCWIKKELQGNTIPIGYANGIVGYIPTADAFDNLKTSCNHSLSQSHDPNGGCDYEVCGAQVLYGFTITKTLDEKIRNMIKDIGS